MRWFTGKNRDKVFKKKITRRNSFQEAETLKPVFAKSKRKFKKKTTKKKPLLNMKCNTHTKKCSMLGNPFASFPFSTLLCPRSWGNGLHQKAPGPQLPLCCANGSLRADFTGEKPEAGGLIPLVSSCKFPSGSPSLNRKSLLFSTQVPPSRF